jgi:hypothetical protein
MMRRIWQAFVCFFHGLGPAVGAGSNAAQPEINAYKGIEKKYALVKMVLPGTIRAVSGTLSSFRFCLLRALKSR